MLTAFTSAPQLAEATWCSKMHATDQDTFFVLHFSLVFCCFIIPVYGFFWYDVQVMKISSSWGANQLWY
jgi:FtsH-binding integral membrane protein